MDTASEFSKTQKSLLGKAEKWTGLKLKNGKL
jgi:hypothetical protein